MNINLKPLWDNLSTQALIGIAIVALVVIVAGILTQGFGRTLGAVCGIFLLAGIIVALGNIQGIANWVKGKIFSGTILPLDMLKVALKTGLWKWW